MTGMQVLLRIDTGLVPDKRPAKDRALAAFARVKDEYDRTAGAGAYLYESDDEDEMLGLLNPIDGRDDPGWLVRIAENWNAGIQKTYTDAVRALQDAAPEGNYLAHPDKVYPVKKAAMALDGDFYMFADYALLVDGHGGFTVLMRDDDMARIRACPGDYLIISVFPK